MTELEKTPVAGADQREAVVKYTGMPLSAIVGLVLAYGLIIALMPNWYYRFAGFAVLLIVAGAISAVVRRDHNALRIGLLWCQSKGRSLTNRFWNGASVDPFPTRRCKTPRGIA